MSPLEQAFYPAAICVLCASEMLVQDAVWSAATKAISDGRTRDGAFLNSLGDGLGKAMSILTIMVIAHSATFSIEAAQVVGNMIGAYAGVYVGSKVSLLLDSTFSWFHRHPFHKPLLVLPRLNARLVMVPEGVQPHG